MFNQYTYNSISSVNHHMHDLGSRVVDINNIFTTGYRGKQTSFHETIHGMKMVERRDFSNPDEWDLLVKNKNNQIIKVEVKSSGPAENTLNFDICLNERRLAVKPGEQKDINVQVYFMPDSYEKFAYLIAWADKKTLDELQRSGTISTFGTFKPRKVFTRKLGEYNPLKELLECLA